MTPATVQTQSRHASEFYKRVIQVFQENDIDFLVGGAFAFVRYTGIGRDTKDLDLFIRRADWDSVTRALGEEGITTELTFPHWLGKAFGGRQREFFVDLIFSGGNGVAEVDDEWFANAVRDESLGFPVRLMPVEEMIWSKAFLMERERFDGADVLHLIRARQKDINWPRLLSRFGEHWRVLLSHLVLFPYVYPNEPAPQDVIDELLDRAKHEPKADEGIRLCRGPLLSRAQYLVDVERWNYVDAREVPLGTMTPEEIDIWTQAIETKKVSLEPEPAGMRGPSVAGRDACGCRRPPLRLVTQSRRVEVVDVAGIYVEEIEDLEHDARAPAQTHSRPARSPGLSPPNARCRLRRASAHRSDEGGRCRTDAGCCRTRRRAR